MVIGGGLSLLDSHLWVCTKNMFEQYPSNLAFSYLGLYRNVTRFPRSQPPGSGVLYVGLEAFGLRSAVTKVLASFITLRILNQALFVIGLA